MGYIVPTAFEHSDFLIILLLLWTFTISEEIWNKPIISYLRIFPFNSTTIHWFKKSPQQTIIEITGKDNVLPSKKVILNEFLI